MSRLVLLFALIALAGCDTSDPVLGEPIGAACAQVSYPDWQTSDYALPYPPGRSYLVLQGNCSSFSHQTVMEQFAYDWRMPIGTVVVAMRGGIVDTTVSVHEDGNRVRSDVNGVLILHDDGTYGRYLHFTRGGVTVEMGARVAQGDTIGYSGDTGFSTEPHLHIDVLTNCREGVCDGVPITFQNTAANPAGLMQGRVYTAR